MIGIVIRVHKNFEMINLSENSPGDDAWFSDNFIISKLIYHFLKHFFSNFLFHFHSFISG